MSYQIQAGDCLYNIVKSQYGLTNEADITKKIDEVAKANNIENPDLIFAGATLELPGDGFSSENAQAGNFDNWLQNQGADGSEFQMFNMNPETYHNDIKGFSQSYINQYDEDQDGKLNAQEFQKMISGGVELSNDQLADVQKVFAGMNIDNDTSNIDASELATQFMMADFDSSKLQQGGKFADGLDGKFSFNQYQQSLLNLTDDSVAGNIKQQKQNIYNTLFSQVQQ